VARAETTHDGTSWMELQRSYASNRLYALIEPKASSPDQRRILIKVTRLSGFESGSFFFCDGTTLNGKKIELYGYGRHTPDDPCTFEVHKISG